MHGFRPAPEAQIPQRYTQQPVPRPAHLPNDFCHGEEDGYLRERPAELAIDCAIPPLIQLLRFLLDGFGNGGPGFLGVAVAAALHELVALLVGNCLSHGVCANVAGHEGARVGAGGGNEKAADEEGGQRKCGVPWEVVVQVGYHFVGEVEEGIDGAILAGSCCVEIAFSRIESRF